MKTCRNCPPQHQRGIWQCAKSDSRLRSPAHLDVSFHCEGGFCLVNVCGPTYCQTKAQPRLSCEALGPAEPVESQCCRNVTMCRQQHASFGFHVAFMRHLNNHLAPCAERIARG